MSSKTLITSGSAFESQIGYSRAVIIGSWILVSGTTGYNFPPYLSSFVPPFLSSSTHPSAPNLHSYDYITSTISPSIEMQCEQALQNIQAALSVAGSSMKDVVRVRYILPDAKMFPRCWPILKRWFGDVKPVATMLQAGLMEEVMLIEIEVTARKGAGSDGELPL